MAFKRNINIYIKKKKKNLNCGSHSLLLVSSHECMTPKKKWNYH